MIRKTLSAGLVAVASFTLSARPCRASVLDICDVTARVIAMEDVPLLSAGSKKIFSEDDPRDVRFNSFARLMTLEVLRAIPYSSGVECSLEPHGAPQKILMDGVPREIEAGDELRLVREFYFDLTPEGISSQIIWSIPIQR